MGTQKTFREQGVTTLSCDVPVQFAPQHDSSLLYGDLSMFPANSIYGDVRQTYHKRGGGRV